MSFNGLSNFPNRWKVQTVGELVEKGILEKPLDGNHGEIHPKASDYVEQGIPFIMASNLEGGQVDLTNCKFISEKQAKTLRKGFAKIGDVLLSHKATIGRTAIVQDSEYPFIVLTPQITCYRINDVEKLVPSYLKAYFDSSFFQTMLSQWAGSGSTRAYLGITGQLKLPVVVPPIEFQNLIASQAKALNEKIQVNYQINQTLETMAQAVFKSWFVDFDPVRAKIAALGEGEDPLRAAMCAISGKTDAELEGMSGEDYEQLAATAALFPDAMEDSELGEIPRGWGVKTVSDIARFAVGRVSVPELTVENYISTENMLENRGGIKDATSLPSSVTVPVFKKRHVLVSNIRPYFKKIWLACFDGGRSNDVLAFESIEHNSAEFLYNLLYQDEFFDFMMRTSKGAKMPRGDKQAIMDWEFVCAGKELMELFSEKVRSFYLYRDRLDVQSQGLAELRDVLLPELLSGGVSLDGNVTFIKRD